MFLNPFSNSLQRSTGDTDGALDDGVCTVLLLDVTLRLLFVVCLLSALTFPRSLGLVLYRSRHVPPERNDTQVLFPP